MTRRIWSAILVIAAALATAVSGQEAPGGRAVEDPLLDSLVGHWNLSREIRNTRERNTLDVEWVLQHRFLQLHMKDVANPPKYEAIVLVGYDDPGRRYVIHWCDTFGGGFSSIGYGKRTDDSIEFVFEDADSRFYNTFSRDPATGTWTFLMQSQGKDGKRAFFAKDTLSRR
jgi:hypothetical protein